MLFGFQSSLRQRPLRKPGQLVGGVPQAQDALPCASMLLKARSPRHAAFHT